MIDMKCKPESKTLLGDVTESDKPEYPYGLRISLDSESLAKLGITELPTINAELKIAAVARVVSVSQYESQGNEKASRTVDLQIEQMELAPIKGDARGMYANSNMNP